MVIPTIDGNSHCEIDRSHLFLWVLPCACSRSGCFNSVWYHCHQLLGSVYKATASIGIWFIIDTKWISEQNIPWKLTLMMSTLYVGGKLIVKFQLEWFGVHHIMPLGKVDGTRHKSTWPVTDHVLNWLKLLRESMGTRCVYLSTQSTHCFIFNWFKITLLHLYECVPWNISQLWWEYSSLRNPAI